MSKRRPSQDPFNGQAQPPNKAINFGLTAPPRTNFDETINAVVSAGLPVTESSFVFKTEFRNFTILVEDRPLFVNAALLGSVSPVFRRMCCTEGFREAANMSAEIKEEAFDDIHLLFRVIMPTETSLKPEEVTTETLAVLLHLADKYDVQALQRSLDQFLAQAVMHHPQSHANLDTIYYVDCMLRNNFSPQAITNVILIQARNSNFAQLQAINSIESIPRPVASACLALYGGYTALRMTPLAPSGGDPQSVVNYGPTLPNNGRPTMVPLPGSAFGLGTATFPTAVPWNVVPGPQNNLPGPVDKNVDFFEAMNIPSPVGLKDWEQRIIDEMYNEIFVPCIMSFSSEFTEPSTFRDFQIVVEGESLFVNAQLLASLSSVFNGMCCSESFREAQEKRVEIKEEKFDDVHLLFRTIMPTERNINMEKITVSNVLTLLRLADKFDVQPLLISIDDLLPKYSNLSGEMAISCLELALRNRFSRACITKLVLLISEQNSYAQLISMSQNSNFPPAILYACFAIYGGFRAERTQKNLESSGFAGLEPYVTAYQTGSLYHNGGGFGRGASLGTGFVAGGYGLGNAAAQFPSLSQPQPLSEWKEQVLNDMLKQLSNVK